jgi:hypothetical protein
VALHSPMAFLVQVHRAKSLDHWEAVQVVW